MLRFLVLIAAAAGVLAGASAAAAAPSNPPLPMPWSPQSAIAYGYPCTVVAGGPEFRFLPRGYIYYVTASYGAVESCQGLSSPVTRQLETCLEQQTGAGYYAPVAGSCVVDLPTLDTDTIVRSIFVRPRTRYEVFAQVVLSKPGQATAWVDAVGSPAFAW